MRDKTGGSAFPTPRFTVDGEARFTGFSIHTDGMYLRDYFAAKAMGGLVANNGTNPVEIAKAAYVIADFMLKAREE